ncbi:MAG: Ref family protein [Kiritimatiellaceae bacterium]|nr:Ref family protein [Kiritimatiellaceae bacterium]
MRPYSKSDKEWISAIVELGCIVCINEMSLYTEPCPHHTKGKVIEGCHKMTIPLCGPHHQTGGYGVAFHEGKAAWTEKFGTERELHEQTKSMVTVENEYCI